MEQITIKDIAKALNLSTSTVSRALRGSYEISEDTKQLVIEYAKKVKYRPNPIALSLKENKSKAIGVIVPEIANNFFSNAINGIEEVAHNRGYHVVIFQSHESFERESINVQHIFDRKCDGLLISLSGNTTDIQHIEAFRENNFPVVYFDRVPESTNVHKVVADNFDGAFKATEYLINNGNKKIAHITSPLLLSISQERLAGYKAALEKHGIEFDPDLVKYCGFVPQEAFETIEHLILHKQPDAYFICSDRLALHCFEASKKNLHRMPKNVKFVGFTNLNVAHLLDPALTTVVQPAFEIGQTAAEILLDVIEKKKKEPEIFQTRKLYTELKIR